MGTKKKSSFKNLTSFCFINPVHSFILLPETDHFKKDNALYIWHYLQWQQHKIARDGQLLMTTGETESDRIPEAIYRQAGIAYPKFFKMDPLSRVAFLAAELLLPAAIKAPKHKIATVISTSSGCLEVDKKFDESRKTLASPALFVYTLPNIMLGEIDIRHGFKGEQMCTVSDKADIAWLSFYVSDLLQHRGTEACLCGHVEAAAGNISATVCWVSQSPPEAGTAVPFTTHNLESIFSHSLI
jgi:hypothetical protein